MRAISWFSPAADKIPHCHNHRNLSKMELNLLVIVIFGVISCLLGLAQLMIAFQQHLWMLEARRELSRINWSVSSIHLGQHLTVNGSTSRSFPSDMLR